MQIYQYYLICKFTEIHVFFLIIEESQHKNFLVFFFFFWTFSQREWQLTRAIILGKVLNLMNLLNTRA